MTSTKELALGFILILIAASFIGIYSIISRPSARTMPTLAYEEIVVSKSRVMEPARTNTLSIGGPAIIKAAPLPIVPPRIISQVVPEYPEAALKGGIEGLVLVSAKIGITGNIENAGVKSSSGSDALDRSAVSAVSKWTFSPTLQNGQAISSIFEVPVRFKIK